MAQPPEDKKVDISSLPRGAIGINGLQVSRNTRLPSFRSPRDLNLGTTSKRTFMPNIPPRREKKSSTLESKITPNKEKAVIMAERKNVSFHSERGRGRGRGKANIIQTQGSVFADGIAQNIVPRKERIGEAYQKPDTAAAPKRIMSIKKEQQGENDVASISRKMNELFRDDFIDDSDDMACAFKPTTFPPNFEVKEEEVKSEVLENVNAPESVVNFNPNVAQEMGYDVNHIAKFIKKEKGTEVNEEIKPTVSTKDPENELTHLLNGDVPQLVLLQFPQCVTVPQIIEDSQSESNSRRQSVNGTAQDKKQSCVSIASFPEGCVGKLRVMKSGKVRLILGGLTFDLENINKLQSKHEIVSIRTDSNGGDLTVLGDIHYKLKFSPDLNSLLS